MAVEFPRPTPEQVFPLVDQMTFEDKVALVERLLSRRSGLSVTLGRDQETPPLTVQITTLDNFGLSEILQAIARRIDSSV